MSLLLVVVVLLLVFLLRGYHVLTRSYDRWKQCFLGEPDGTILMTPL